MLMQASEQAQLTSKTIKAAAEVLSELLQLTEVICVRYLRIRICSPPCATMLGHQSDFLNHLLTQQRLL